MDRAFKWLLPFLIIVEASLVRFGLLDWATAVGIIVAVEALLLLVVGRQIIVAVGRFRRDRESGLDVWAALEDGLATLLPRRLARLVALEPKVWLCLGMWLLRRHNPGQAEFGYRRRSIVGALLIVVVFTTPVELLLFELLIPWAWLRWALLILAVYALVWAFGFYASLHVLPHRLEATGIRLRYGILADGLVPYSEIAHVGSEDRRAPGIGDGLQLARNENAAYIAVGGRTDVSLQLRSACVLNGLLGPLTPVRTVHVAVDEPERLVMELAQRVSLSSYPEPGIG